MLYTLTYAMRVQECLSRRFERRRGLLVGLANYLAAVVDIVA